MNLDEIPTIRMPDGLIHVNLEGIHCSRIEARIRNAEDIFKLMLVDDVLNRREEGKYILHIPYLNAMRMDRRIDENQPFSLDVVGRMLDCLKHCRFIRIDCPHSDAVFSMTSKLNVHQTVLDFVFYEKALKRHSYVLTGESKNATIVLPDGGMVKRWYTRYHDYFSKYGYGLIDSVVECSKRRDMQTGKLSGFKIVEGDVADKHVVIVDDLCDGGGTFTGLAKVLLDAGAASVSLAVYHGIFSKGYDLEGITDIYTTNSYKEHNHRKVWTWDGVI